MGHVFAVVHRFAVADADEQQVVFDLRHVFMFAGVAALLSVFLVGDEQAAAAFGEVGGSFGAVYLEPPIQNPADIAYDYQPVLFPT